METKKIAITIFLGIFVGAMVVLGLTVTPLLRWLLGVLVGSSVGLLWYDLKEVREKAPFAWEKAKRGSKYSLDWLKRPHPLLYLFLVITGILCFAMVKLIWSSSSETSFGGRIFVTVLLSLMLCGINVMIFLATVVQLVRVGAHRKKCYWELSTYIFPRKAKEEAVEKNYTKIPLTYRNIYGLMLTGLAYVLLTALLTTPKILKKVGKGLLILFYFMFYRMWVVLAKFLWILLKLIHSQKRVLCGFDSAIGVVITYFWLGAKAVTPEQKIVVVICGGIIGAVVGVLNFEIISKRLLHLVPATNNL